MKKRPLCVMCLIFLIIQGMILIIRGGQSYTEMPASSIFRKPEGQEVCVTGQVYNKRITSNTQILFLKINSNSNQENLILYDLDFTNISIGQVIQVIGTISHFDEARNPGNFDQTLYYAKEDIYGAVFCEKVVQISGEASVIREHLFQRKCAWKEILIECMGEKQGNVLAAMLLGEKSEMDEETKEQYQKSGIGHVLAISGLHISFIGLGIYQLLRKIRIPFGVAGIMAVGILSLYACMIGFSVSVFRAYVMLLLKIGADVTGRIYDVMTALMLSAAITVWRQPLYLMDAGFYLSYGAVLGLLLLVPYLTKGLMGKRKWTAVLIPGLCINIALLPIQLWYYYEIPTYSLLINLLVIPLMSGVLALGIIGSGALAFSFPYGQMSLHLCRLILELYKAVSGLTVGLPVSRIVTGQPEIWELVLYYVILFLILIKVLKRKAAIIISYLLSVFLLVYTPTNGLQVTMLDVGQGDCLFVKGPTGITYLVDGGSSDVKEVGKYRIEPYLKYEGVRSVDYAFVSHGDGDHYSGIMEMLKRQTLGVEIRNLVLPEYYKEDANLMRLATVAKENKSKVVVIKEGVTLREEDLEIACIMPERDNELNGNEGSMVLEVSYKKFKMLCAADIEGEGENRLAERIEGRNYEVLKVSHHGSKNSSQKEFIDAVTIRYALISAGQDNSYGHPHKETIERLTAEKCKIYQTPECGAVIIKTDGDFIDILSTSI